MDTARSSPATCFTSACISRSSIPGFSRTNCNTRNCTTSVIFFGNLCAHTCYGKYCYGYMVMVTKHNSVLIAWYSCNFRGDFFRREFSMLGEVRSLIPPEVHIMALTATASVKTRDRIIKMLGMDNPCVISVSPHNANMVYWVFPKTSIEEDFGPVMKQLREVRYSISRMIVFCRHYDDCASLYQSFRLSLGNEFTEPIGAPNLSRFRLVDMFTHPTKKEVKDLLSSRSVSLIVLSA